jgi:hypothetical protein
MVEINKSPFLMKLGLMSSTYSGISEPANRYSVQIYKNLFKI